MRTAVAALLGALVLAAAAPAEEYKSAKVRIKLGKKITIDTSEGTGGKQVTFFVAPTTVAENTKGKTLKGTDNILPLLREGNIIDVTTTTVPGKPYGQKGDVEQAVQIKVVKWLTSEDVAVPGSEFEGNYKGIKVSVNSRGKVITTPYATDMRLVIKTRESDRFTGEWWQDRNTEGMEIAGTISNTGVVKFTYKKIIRGSWPNDVVGVFTWTAAINGKNLKGAGGTGNRAAEFTAKLKD